MRAANSTLIAALLAKTPMFSADLFEIELTSGTILYITSFPRDLVSGGITYTSVGPSINRSTWEVKNTIDVPSMTLQLYSSGNDYGSINIKNAIHNGLLDGAYITLSRVFMPTAGDTSFGQVILFGGYASTVTVDGLGAKITVKGENVFMQQNMPKNEYKLACIWKLYGPMCTVVRSTKTITNTVGTAGITNSFIPWGTLPANPSYYSQGTLTMTSGVASGSQATVATGNNSGLILAYPLYETPAAGDTFSVVQGCARTASACTNQFSNFQNFRGFLSIPPAQTAV